MSNTTTGLVFDIREFTVHDGPGLRTTVFMKGCPLECMWCHNPEGQSNEPQMMVSPAGRRLAGTEYTPRELAALLNRQAPIFRANEGGVTFSGGEPLMQAPFLAEVIDLLDDIHVLLDTSGYGPASQFQRLLARVNLVHYDLKLIDPAAHLHYTGCDNRLILANLNALEASGVPYVIRVPLVPGVTDTDANLTAIAEMVQGSRGMLRVDLLPYNRQAGAKYAATGKHFQPDYDETQPVRASVALFEERGIKVRVT
jgi:pyruvate formate lyase activating enzyme